MFIFGWVNLVSALAYITACKHLMHTQTQLDMGTLTEKLVTGLWF